MEIVSAEAIAAQAEVQPKVPPTTIVPQKPAGQVFTWSVDGNKLVLGRSGVGGDPGVVANIKVESMPTTALLAAWLCLCDCALMRACVWSSVTSVGMHHDQSSKHLQLSLRLSQSFAGLTSSIATYLVTHGLSEHCVGRPSTQQAVFWQPLYAALSNGTDAAA